MPKKRSTSPTQLERLVRACREARVELHMVSEELRTGILIHGEPDPREVETLEEISRLEAIIARLDEAIVG